MTAAVLSEIERAIRQDPGQWFWYNRRWVLDPVDTPQEGLGNRDPAQ